MYIYIHIRTDRHDDLGPTQCIADGKKEKKIKMVWLSAAEGRAFVGERLEALRVE